MFPYIKFPLKTKFMFRHPKGEADEMFKFSSDLEKVGVEWDVAIKNGSYVQLIEGPVEINRPPYGTISLMKVKADVATDYHTITKEFWVPTACIVEIKDDETSSSTLPN